MFANCTKKDIRDLKKLIKEYIVDNLKCSVRKEHRYCQEYTDHVVSMSLEGEDIFEFTIEG